MKWCVMLLLTLATVACATARDDAAYATNTAQSVLSAVDEVWAPIVQSEIARSKPLDDAAYREHMEPWLAVQELIESARRATQLLNLAVQTWDAQADGGAMWREVVPCVIQDLQLARALLIPREANAPPQLTRALSLVESMLAVVFVPLGKCPGKRSDETIPAVPPHPAASAALDAGAAP